jgi:hypothetical protein
MNQISESSAVTNICKVITQLIAGCSPTMPVTVKQTFLGVCRWVSRKLTETIEIIYYYIVKTEEFLCKLGNLE